MASPSFNRRGSPAPASSTANTTTVTTPQRPGSRGSYRGTPTGTPSGNPEAALSSLQELIRTMPAPTESPSAASSGANNQAQPAPAPASTTGVARSSPAPPLVPPQPRLRSTSGGVSALNPNAGGFQPGALSSLGEVEHEVLNTPLASTFGSPRHHAHQQSVGNVFGSPLQTPQSQIGQAHYAQQQQEWQNFHNVFNAGIGNNGGGNAGGGVQSPNSFAAAAGLDVSGMDPSLVSAAMAMNPMQAQLAMLQALQMQQQQLSTGGNAFSSPQQNLLLQQQQQQLQLQALMAAQLQLHQQTGVQQQHQQVSSPGSMPASAPRFGQSASQPDLASIAAGAGGATANSQFMAEQNALTAQYEALRQQQQDLMLRFSEMQYQAAQLAQAQQQQQAASQPAQQQQQQQQQNNASSQQQQPMPGQPATGRNSSAPHRRGPSASISGPMGQFGSMGNFALPSNGTAGGSISGLGGLGQPSTGAGGGVPKGHGRRHSVNVNNNKNTINSAFSFPAGNGNPTQAFALNDQMGNLGIGGAPQPTQEDLEHAPPPTSRMYGHGRRESRGSIGSLAGWGSSASFFRAGDDHRPS